MRTCAGTKGLTAIGPGLCAFAASYDSKTDVPGPFPVATSFAPSSSAQATCESLDTLAVGVVTRIGPPPANSYQLPLTDIGAHPFTWANGSVTTKGEAKTESIEKAGGSGVEMAVKGLVLTISRGFGKILHGVRFSFGEYGGNVNVSVNTTLGAAAGDRAADGDPSLHRASQFSKEQGANSCVRYGFRGQDRQSWGSGTPRRACWPGSASGHAEGAPAAPPH